MRFAGQWYDRDAGLVYNHNRWYDSRVGRYLRPDPLFEQGQWQDPYMYVQGNPYTFSDPLGLWVVVIWESVEAGTVFGGFQAIGFAFDSHGNYGSVHTTGIGVSAGIEAGTNIGASIYSADRIRDLDGPGSDVNFGGKWLAGGGVVFSAEGPGVAENHDYYGVGGFGGVGWGVAFGGAYNTCSKTSTAGNVGDDMTGAYNGLYNGIMNLSSPNSYMGGWY